MDLDLMEKDIMAAIEAEPEETTRKILMYQLKVLREITSRMDAFMANVRSSVLNGHDDVHHEHHNWVARRISEEAQIENERRWVQERMASDCHAACAWANKKRMEEAEDIETNRKNRNAAKWHMVERIVWAALVFLAAFFWGK